MRRAFGQPPRHSRDRDVPAQRARHRDLGYARAEIRARSRQPKAGPRRRDRSARQNYVTARFGAKASTLTADDVRKLRAME